MVKLKEKVLEKTENYIYYKTPVVEDSKILNRKNAYSSFSTTYWLSLLAKWIIGIAIVLPFLGPPWCG